MWKLARPGERRRVSACEIYVKVSNRYLVKIILALLGIVNYGFISIMPKVPCCD